MTKSKLTTALLITSLALPAGASAVPDKFPQDLRSPDAQDAAVQVQQQNREGLRSPDAQDAAAQVQEQNRQGLRSPDAQDAADPTPQPQTVTAVVPVERTVSDGFDWADAAIGASILLGLLAIGGGAYVVVNSRHGYRVS